MLTYNFTAQLDNPSQIEAINAFMKALKIKFISNKDESYNPKYVALLEQSKKDIAAGKGVKMNLDDLKKSWK